MQRHSHRKKGTSDSQKERDRSLRAKYAAKPSLSQLRTSKFTAPVKQGEYLAMMQFAAELKQLRDSQNLSLADVAQRSGIDKAAISRLENGLAENPTIGTLERLARSVGKRIRITFE